MSDIHISLVPPEHVPAAWESVEPFMERAVEMTNGRYAIEDIYDALMHRNHNLWIVFTGNRVLGSMVTAIRQYPRKTYLELSFIGGDEGMEWKDQMLDILQRWAYDNNCNGIESCARLGWAKIFKDDGYRPMWQMFELPMGEEGLGE